MSKNSIIAIIAVVVIVIAAGGYAIASRNNSSTNSNNTSTTTPTVSSTQQTTTSTPTQSQSTATSTPTSSAVKTDSFTVNANDDSADLTKINVNSGDVVKITFNVETQGTYHGGLNFVAPDSADSSGPIATGSSKTVTFTATKSFTYTPYWYSTNIQKPYNIQVNVS